MRVPVVSVAALIAAGLAQVSPACAEPLIAKVMDYYDVTGTTPQEIRASLDQLSPTSTRDGKHYDSITYDDITARFTFRGLPNCAITSTDVTATIKIRFPRLQADARTPRPVQQAFARYLEKRMVHEQGHIDKIVETARQMEIGISGLPPIQSCRGLEAAAKHLGSNLLENLHRWRREYDDRTLRGRAQGAKFP